METPPDVTEDYRKWSRIARLALAHALEHGFSMEPTQYAAKRNLPHNADTFTAYMADELGLHIISDDGSEETVSQHMAEVA